MAEFAYLDESLDINQTGMYHLSIQVGLNGLSFCLLNTVDNKYIALKHYPLLHDDKEGLREGLRKVVARDEFLGRNYRSVAWMPAAFHSTIVPTPLYKEEEKERFLLFNHTPPEGSELVLANPVKGLDAHVVFAVEEELAGLFEELFPGARVFHPLAPFLGGILRYLGVKGKETALYANIHDEMFDLAVFRGPSPLLINSYRYRKVNDIVYFLLYAYRTLDLDPALTPVILQGKVNTSSSLVETLRRYVKKISFARRDPSFTYSYTFNMVAEQTFVNLFNLYSCV